ncbi:hypothetical protein COOONC_07989 [Cooperia oncophora]
MPANVCTISISYIISFQEVDDDPTTERYIQAVEATEGPFIRCHFNTILPPASQAWGYIDADPNEPMNEQLGFLATFQDGTDIRDKFSVYDGPARIVDVFPRRRTFPFQFSRPAQSDPDAEAQADASRHDNSPSRKRERKSYPDDSHSRPAKKSKCQCKVHAEAEAEADEFAMKVMKKVRFKLI